MPVNRAQERFESIEHPVLPAGELVAEMGRLLHLPPAAIEGSTDSKPRDRVQTESLISDEFVEFDTVQAKTIAIAEIRSATAGHPEVSNFTNRYREKSRGPEKLLTGDQLTDYLNMSEGYRLLDKGDEIVLFKHLRKGFSAYERVMSSQEITDADEMKILRCAGAYEVLLQTNIRLVVSVAMKKQHLHSDKLPDLIQEGMLGLSRAICDYDYRRNQKLSTYATWWIKQSIERYIANTGRAIRIPVHQHEVWKKISKTRADMTMKLERRPSNSELAERLGMNKDEVEDYLRIGSYELRSLNKPVGEDGELEMGQLIPEPGESPIAQKTEELDEDKLMNRMFEEAGLSLEEMQVLSLHFGIFRPELVGSQFTSEDGGVIYYEQLFSDSAPNTQYSQTEIGALLGCHPRQIRKKRDSGFEKIQMSLPAISDYLD